MTEKINKQYTVKKRQLGLNGKWFWCRGVRYASEAEALEAAQRFAEQQCAADIAGTAIDVFRQRECIAEFKWPDRVVRMVDWRS